MSACQPVCSPYKISPLRFPWALKLFLDLPHFILSARRSCASSFVVLQARVWWPRGRRRRFPPAPAVRRGDGGGSSGDGGGGGESSCAHESHGRAKDSVRVSAVRERASEPGLPFLSVSLAAYSGGKGREEPMMGTRRRPLDICGTRYPREL